MRSFRATYFSKLYDFQIPDSTDSVTLSIKRRRFAKMGKKEVMFIGVHYYSKFKQGLLFINMG